MIYLKKHVRKLWFPWGLLIVALFLFSFPKESWGQESNQDRYLQIFLLITEADKLYEGNQKASARQRYELAFEQLNAFPSEWEPAIVGYRKKYLQEKVKELKGLGDANPKASQKLTDLPQISQKPSEGTLSGSNQKSKISSGTEKLRSRITDLETQLESTKAELKRVVVERNQLREQLVATQSQLAAAKAENTEAQVAGLLKENSQLKAQLKVAEEQMKNLQQGQQSTSVAMLKVQLQKVQEQLAFQQKQNTEFQSVTSDLKERLDEAKRQLHLAKQRVASAQNPEAYQRENAILRDIVQRQLQEQARREYAKRLTQEELDNLKVQSEVLRQQIDILGSPLIVLSEEERGILRLSHPELYPLDELATNQLVAQISSRTSHEIPSEVTPVKPSQEPATPSSEILQKKSLPIPISHSIDTPLTSTEIAPSLPSQALSEESPEKKPEAPSPSLQAPQKEKPASKPKEKLPEPPSTLASTPSSKEPSSSKAEAKAKKQEPPAVAVASQEKKEDFSSKPRIPNDVRHLAQQASDLFAQGRYKEAIKLYEQIMEQYPESLYAWSNLGVVHFQQGNYDEAEKALKQAVKLAPSDNFSFSILGIVFYQKGNWEEAIKALTRAKALEPNDPKTRNYLGIACSQKGWQSAAEKELRKAVELDSQYGDAHFNLAVIYATQRPPSKEMARQHYQEAQKLGIPPDKQLERLLQ